MAELITYYDLLTAVKEERPLKFVWLSGERYIWDAKEHDYVHEDDERLYLSAQIMAYLPSMKEFVTRPILAHNMAIPYGELLFRIRRDCPPKRVAFREHEYIWDGDDYLEDSDDYPVLSLSSEVGNMPDRDIASDKCIYILEDFE